MRINLPKHPADMNSIVNQAEESGEVRVFRRDLVRSDLWYAKNRIEDWQILWQGGKLSALPGVDELLHFHFISSKRNKEFHVEPLSGENGFTVTARGIRPVQ